MKFEWDEVKAMANLEKHGVSFIEAQQAFEDPFALHGDDLPHSLTEDRYILIGQTLRGILTVIYTERQGLTIRLISARKASRQERRNYYG